MILFQRPLVGIQEWHYCRTWKPEERRVVADTLKKAICSGVYQHDRQQYMCSAVLNLEILGEISRDACELTRNFMYQLLMPDQLLANYLKRQDDFEYREITDEFTRHIFHCRYYWQLIRLIEKTLLLSEKGKLL